MKLVGLRELLIAEWVRAAAVEKACGASAGACRALVAHGRVDVAEVLATVRDAGDRGPGKGAKLLTAWREWYPSYVSAEVARILPDVVRLYPTQAERVQRRSTDRARERLAKDCAAIVDVCVKARECLMTEPELAIMCKIRPGRLRRLLAVLERAGAVSLKPASRVVALMSPEAVFSAFR